MYLYKKKHKVSSPIGHLMVEREYMIAVMELFNNHTTWLINLAPR